MPILNSDTELMEESVDASGRYIINKELPSVNASGYPITPQELEQSREQAALTKAEPKEEVKEETIPETKEETKEPSEKEARKLFLAAQKAQRRAEEMEKKAQASVKKAEAFEAAKALVDNGEDPTALIKAAGYDPVDFYKKMTAYALSDKGKPEDPIQKQLREQQEKIVAFEKRQQESDKALAESQELAQHQQKINTHVIPMLQANPDRFEALHAQYGNQTAVEVYKAVYEHYLETGEMVPFDQAADQMEAYWLNQYESGLKEASKLKKLNKFFAQTQSAPTETLPDHSEKPRRSNTLSNKNTTSAAPVPANKAYDRYLSREERALEVLKKFGE